MVGNQSVRVDATVSHKEGNNDSIHGSAYYNLGMFGVHGFSPYNPVGWTPGKREVEERANEPASHGGVRTETHLASLVSVFTTVYNAI